MAKPSPRPPVAGPPLIRALDRLGARPTRDDSPDLPASLAVWIDWNRAVALAGALDGRLPEPPGTTPPEASALRAERQRSHATHADAIDALCAELATAGSAIDATGLQRRHADLQRSQLASTGRLRGALRDRLALQDAQGARLAAVDAVLEQAISPREYRAMDTLPALLSAHVATAMTPAPDRADTVTPDADGSTAGGHTGTTAALEGPLCPPAGSWPTRLRDDIRALLLAELDLRFQPLDGLLAALDPH